MDYKQKYKEALERASKIHSKKRITGIELVTCEEIFPELRESEDEKWRNWLIGHLKGYINQTDDKYAEVCKKAIAWLEKQGEQKPAEWHREDEQNLNACLGYIQDEFLRRWLTDIIHVKYDKSVDKVEPKFKVGDWVVYNRNDHSREILQIYDIRDNRYYFNDNIHFSWSIKECDEKSHLWTIQDAKDGDVLCYKDEMFILKNYVLFHMIVYHCCYDGKNFIPHSIYSLTNDDFNNVHPATKEQRDLLFKKMKEAGYEWDAEKKELKKIPNALEECEIEHIEHGKYYYCIKDYYAGGNKIASKGEVVQALRGMRMMGLGVKANEYFIPVKCIVDVRPAWSEEDEKEISKLIKFFVWEDTGYRFTKEDCLEATNWLKSLKDRVQPQPKQEWSKEDEIKIEKLLKWLSLSLGYNDEHLQSEIKEIIDWLNSLKPKNRLNQSEVKNETKNKCPNYSEGYGCSTSPLKQCDTCPDYKLYNYWKPSEQNIKDLEWCADLVKDKMGVGFHRLQVFIDEIKKL